MSTPLTPRRGPARKEHRPGRALAALVALLLALLGGIAASTQWGKPAGQWTPKLGLDLEGGREIVLEPAIGQGRTINAAQVAEAVDIIRRRVDGSGVAEAEVSTLGERNIVVSIPGQPSEQLLQTLSRSSQLTMRAVIQTAPNQPPEIELPRPPSVQAPGATSGASSTPSPSSSSQPSATSSGASPAPATPSSASPSSAGANGVFPAAFASAAPKDPSDTAWAQQPVTSGWVKAGVVDKGATYADLLDAFSCSNPEHRELVTTAPASSAVVACDQEGTSKLLLGPVEVDGSTISDATSGPQTNSQGVQTGGTAIQLTFNAQGKDAFGKMTTRLNRFPDGEDRNKSSIVVDGQVLTALGTRGAITNGRAEITGGFTAESGKALADQLKFGALPFSFKELTNDQLSPQLGQDQLQKGLLAGLIGLALVVLYSLLQYRALGLVTVASLLIAAALTYLSVTLLGYTSNFRLTMAGVTGLIVAIGVTADSFIVYFERVRDEVRSGRPLRAAVETGWARARRTIIISDAVNFLAAAILYLLSESNVKAFAFTLGLTTLIDLVVVMLFTHPMLQLLARTRFFGQGHPLSGLDPERLGARTATYAGRGRVTIADRRAQGGTA